MLRSVYLVVFLAAAFAQAQQTLIPAHLGIPLGTEQAEPSKSSTLNYGLTASTIFDDNAAIPNNINEAKADLRGELQPEARISLTRSRLNCDLFYAPSFTYSSGIKAYNNTARMIGGDIRYFLTKRLSLRMANAYALTTNSYQRFEANSELPNTGILNQVSNAVVDANVRSSSDVAQAEFVYELGRHTSAGVGGNFTALGYRTSENSTVASHSLLHSRDWSGHAFYSHQLTAKYSLGIEYGAQTLFSHSDIGQFSSLSHRVLGLIGIELKPRMQLSLFAGPEFSDLDDSFVAPRLPFTSRLQRSSFAGGASFSREGDHTSLSATFMQQVSDSGLNGGGPAIIRAANLQIRRRLSQRFSIILSGNFLSNGQIDPLSTALLSDFASVGVELSRSLTPHLTLKGAVIRQQFIGGTASALQQNPQHSHDVATISISYNFTRPLGR